MVGGDQHRAGVQVHENFTGQLIQFINGILHRCERLAFGVSGIPTGIHHVVVNVHQLHAFDLFAPFFTAPAFYVLGGHS